MQTWSNFIDKNGCIFGIDKNKIFLLTVHGKKTKNTIQKIENPIDHGKNPRDISNAQLSIISMSEFARIETRVGEQAHSYY